MAPQPAPRPLYAYSRPVAGRPAPRPVHVQPRPPASRSTPTPRRGVTRGGVFRTILFYSILAFGIYAMVKRQWVTGAILLSIAAVWAIIRIVQVNR